MKPSALLSAAFLSFLSTATFGQISDSARGIPVSTVLDSLKAGRERWDRAHVIEYQLQSHAECFCVYRPGAFENQQPLLTIRGQSIIARAQGKPRTPPSPEFTVPQLFNEVEKDARTDERVIDQLELDPVYGFPVHYHGRYPPVPDDWLGLQVDSFAVIRTGLPKNLSRVGAAAALIPLIEQSLSAQKTPPEYVAFADTFTANVLAGWKPPGAGRIGPRVPEMVCPWSTASGSHGYVVKLHIDSLEKDAAIARYEVRCAKGIRGRGFATGEVVRVERHQTEWSIGKVLDRWIT